MSVLRDGGVEAFLRWAEATLSPDELEVLAHIMLAQWDLKRCTTAMSKS